MRYTLRLLTLDQLGRAATLICALELERQQDADTLGRWPFEIGLWVGRAATPNQHGLQGRQQPVLGAVEDHRLPERRPQARPDPPGELPLVRREVQAAFVPARAEPNDRRPICAWSASIGVATSHATSRCRSWPSTSRSIDVCLLPDRHRRQVRGDALDRPGRGVLRAGRPLRPARVLRPLRARPGRALPAPLHPPDLIIQDELHLISGPMGTMVGLYESALDELCSRVIDGKKIRPKDHRLDGHGSPGREPDPGPVQPPGGRHLPAPGSRPPRLVLRRDRIRPARATRGSTRARRPGRSLKVVMLRTYLALLGASQKAYDADGGKKNTRQRRRPLHDACSATSTASANWAAAAASSRTRSTPG